MHRLSVCLACTFFLLPVPTLAEGDLAVRPVKLPVLEIGLGDTGYGVSQNDFELETGKAYQLIIKSTGAKECAWRAPELANTMWMRKVEVNKVEIKASHLQEIEMERAGEAELFFVPIRPGAYEWGCAGLEDKGMGGKFIVK
jgi:uncharacterized cupredoxin-like copper-binding protein